MDRIAEIICADCLDVLASIPPDSIDLIVVDPPYYKMSSVWWDKQWKTEQEYLAWCSLWLKESSRVLKPNGSFYCWGCVGKHHNHAFFHLIDLAETYFIFKNFITWQKQRGYGTQKNWMFTREELVYMVKDDADTTFHPQYTDVPRTVNMHYADKEKQEKYEKSLKSVNKRVTNVWTDIKEPNISWNKKEVTTDHPTPKPVKAMERIVKASSNEGDVVLDFFGGTGATAVACANLNRQYIVSDFVSEYIEETKRRMIDVLL